MLRYFFPSTLLLLLNSTISKALLKAVTDDVLHKDLDGCLLYPEDIRCSRL